MSVEWREQITCPECDKPTQIEFETPEPDAGDHDLVFCCDHCQQRMLVVVAVPAPAVAVYKVSRTAASGRFHHVTESIIQAPTVYGCSTDREPTF